MWYGKLMKGNKMAGIREFLLKRDQFFLPFWSRMLCFLIMWLPVFLSIFPGAFAFDAPTEWEQFKSGELNAHHPIFHSFLIGICLEGGAKFTGSYNVGIAIYTIIQMLIMAAIFSYAISFMRRYKVPVLLRGIALIFWGLSPVVHLFVVSSTKDTLFSGVFLLFLLNLIDMGFQQEIFFQSPHKVIFFMLSAIGMIVLRNNGIYIVLAVLALALVFCSIRKKLFFALLGLLVFQLVYTGPVYHLFHVEKGEICEMLCVPLQQMARTYLYEYNSLEAEDIALLEKVVPREDLLHYVPTLADFVKQNFREDVFLENVGAYCRLWLKWGIKHPYTYLQSFLINTSDYWYPYAVVDGYDPGRERIDFFRFSVGEPGHRVEMLPRIHEMYRALSEDRSASVKPFMFLLISPGWYLLMTMYLGAGFWNRRARAFALPCAALALGEITALLGPVAQVRYVLFLYFAFPVMASFYASFGAVHQKAVVTENTMEYAA